MDNRVIPYRKRERSKKIRWMEKKKRKKIAGTIQSQEDARPILVETFSTRTSGYSRFNDSRADNSHGLLV